MKGITYTEAELAEPCSYCGAEPGQKCTRRHVTPLTYPHMVRRQDALEREMDPPANSVQADSPE